MSKIRERTKDRPIKVDFSQYTITDISDDSVVFGPYELSDYEIPEKMEYMADTIGNIGCDFNPCFHDKLLLAAKPVDDFTWDDGLGHGFRHRFSDGGISPSEPLEALRNITLPSYAWLDDFGAKAEHHFKTAVDDTHSILNFLIELIQMCEGNILKLKELGEKLIKAFKIYHDMIAKGSSHWLAWNFAIKPMIGDFKAILDSLKNAKKRLKWLRKRNNLDTKVKYREGPKEFNIGNIILDASWPSAPAPMRPHCWFEFEIEKMTIQPSAWAWVRFSIPAHLLVGDLGLGLVWSSLAGLFNPLKVAWEAVPFSWLIDWFVSLRTQLQLEAANFSPLKDATILGTGHSLKTKIVGKVYFCTGTEGSVQRVERGDFHYECFNRQPDLPKVEVWPFRVPWEWYNLSILSALLGQKHRRG